MATQVDTTKKTTDRDELKTLVTALTPAKRITLDVDGVEHELPEDLLEQFVSIVQRMSNGEQLTVISVNDELTTQQAADLIGVSRQYVVRMIDENKLAASFTGTHRRVTVQDALAFKANRRSNQRKKLDELSALTEQLGGYSELDQ